MRRAADFALLALLGVFLAVSVGVAAPNPQMACSACNPGFELTAYNYVNQVDVERSTVHIRLHEDGNATWTVRNEVGTNDTAVLRENGNLSTIAKRAVRSGGLPDLGANDGLQPARNISARIDGGTVVIRFTHPQAASRFGSVYLVEYFHVAKGGIVINAANYTIVGPEGTTLTNDPTGPIEDPALEPTVDGRRVTWHGDTNEREEIVTEQVFLAFAPTDDGLAGLKTMTAIGLDVAPTVLGSLVSLVLLQTAVFGLMVFSLVRGVRGMQWTHTPSRLKPAAGVLGGFVGLSMLLSLFVLGDFYSLLLLLVVAPAAVYAVVAGLAWHERTRDYLHSPMGQLFAGLVAVVVVVPVTIPFVGGADATLAERTAIAVKAAALLAPLALCFPLGGAMATGRNVSRWSVATVFAFGVGGVTLVNLADPPTGLARGLLSIGLFVAALLIAAVGVPLVLFGRSMAGSSQRARRPHQHDARPQSSRR